MIRNYSTDIERIFKKVIIILLIKFSNIFFFKIKLKQILTMINSKQNLFYLVTDSFFIKILNEKLKNYLYKKLKRF